MKIIAIKPAPTMTVEQAERERYGPLTNPYFNGEEWMRERVERDMQNGAITYALVKEGPAGELAIWRKGMMRTRDAQVQERSRLRKTGDMR